VETTIDKKKKLIHPQTDKFSIGCKLYNSTSSFLAMLYLW